MVFIVLLALFIVVAAQITEVAAIDDGSGIDISDIFSESMTEVMSTPVSTVEPSAAVFPAASSSILLTGLQPLPTSVLTNILLPLTSSSSSFSLLLSSVQTSPPRFTMTSMTLSVTSTPTTAPTAPSSSSMTPLVSSLYMSLPPSVMESPSGVASSSPPLLVPSSTAISSDALSPSSTAAGPSVTQHTTSPLPPVLTNSLLPSASSLTVPPVFTTSSAPPPLMPASIIAGAAGGAVAVVACSLVLVCVVCICVRKKKRTFAISTGEDGTTLAREYQLVKFSNNGANAEEIVSKQAVEMTTDTFGIKSPPIEIDVGGQKMIFPELPSPVKGGSLPPLIILNPVKPYSGGASTLPTRKKNKIVTEEKKVSSNISDLFGTQVKLSKSTSEINKDVQSGAQKDTSLTRDQQEVDRTSTVYDVPCTFIPSTVENQEVVSEKPSESSSIGGPVSSGAEYVMMEPCSKHTAETAAAVGKLDTYQQPPKRTVDSDRLVPEPIDPSELGATSESIYDNAQLLKPKPLISAEPGASVQVDKSEAYSLYDVPKKLFGNFSPVSNATVKDESLLVGTKSVVEEANPEKIGVIETVYDVPKVFASPPQHGSDSPTGNTVSVCDHSNKVGTIEVQASKKEMPLLLPKLTTKHSSGTATALEEKKEGIANNHILSKPNRNGNASSQVESVYDYPRMTGRATMNSGAENSSDKVADETTHTAKPSVLPKPSVELAGSAQASADSQVGNAASSKEEKTSTKPSIFPKPNSAKPTNKPSVLPKPGTPPRAVVSPKPGAKEKGHTTNPMNDTNQPGDVTSVTSSSDKEASDSPEPGIISPQHDSDTSTSSSSASAPKPRPKPKKAARSQIGLTRNLMQELYTKQNSRTKLSEERNTSPVAKPAVKPKPNMK